jgi:hypothetical protein
MTNWRIALLLAAAFILNNCGGEEPGPPGYPGPQFKSARSYLEPADIEDPGFGAHGYVLFGRSPVGDSTATALLDAWLELPNASGLVRYGESPSGLMQILLPSDTSATASSNGSDLASHYDVDRAARIASVNQLTFSSGSDVPILVVLSILPIATHAPPEKPTVIDFTGASSATIKARFRHLMEKARNRQTWDSTGFKDFVYNLHDDFNEGTDTVCWVLNSIPGGGKVLSWVLKSKDAASACSDHPDGG